MTCGNDYLQTVGIPGLEPSGECPPCGRARVDREHLEQMQATRVEHDDKMMELLSRVGVNVWVHGHLTLDDLKPMVKVPIRKWLDTIASAKKYQPVPGLYLQGEVGTGKTQAAVCVIRELINAGWDRSRIIMDNSREIITEVQDRYSTGRVREYGLARERCGLWILDDVGTEKLTADALRIIEAIIDAREGRPTIITSNYNRGQWAKKWEGMEGWQRLASRMQRYTVVGFEGTDYRKG